MNSLDAETTEIGQLKKGRSQKDQSQKLVTESSAVYEMLEWERRDVSITAADGTQVFAKQNLEFPKSWSQNAANIVAQKYFRTINGKRETSLKDMIGRVVNTIKNWGLEGGYFGEPETPEAQQQAEIFAGELTYLLAFQRASFNSPVWFNIGVEGAVQQSSACFILSVEDSLSSILNWISEEGIIFKGGSGAGVNLSNIRSSKEELSGGGQASGPVSFMRGADASAGAIRSGGTTRRAAKMVVLDADHPDIQSFIWCKALEEKKSATLANAGFSMGIDGSDIYSIQYQNANNSVRLTEEFFEAVKNDADWHLRARGGDKEHSAILETIKARDLLNSIAAAAWECADPGVQYDTTINRWHTAPNAGRISASNPCSEYFHLDDSACNLSSLNLLTFYDSETGKFDTAGFRQAVDTMITAQDILVGFSSYPTKKIGDTARAYRQLGLGFTNLGALIMSTGTAYDSPKARALAGSITALMTGQAYLTSADLAARLAPFEGYENDKSAMLSVLRSHRGALAGIDADMAPQNILEEAEEVWDEAVDTAEVGGVRNSQATVLAPTGTISFMMDCDTTGIEPDLALVKNKQLVGGGSMVIANQSVDRAIKALGYTSEEAQKILDHIAETGSAIDAPGLHPDHFEVFSCAIGPNSITPDGHLLMMAAVQPFISGGISKTVNLPSHTTKEEIADLFCKGHELGLKALAIYRDNSKTFQPLTAKTSASENTASETPQETLPERKHLPRSRNSKTFEFNMSGCKGYVTVGEYEDGKPGEIFVKVSKQGSTLAGTMDAFAIAVSHGLQYGVPLSSFIDAFTGMRFEPTGITDDPELRFATSIIDYIFRRLGLMYLSPAERSFFNIFTSAEREQLTLPIERHTNQANNQNQVDNQAFSGASFSDTSFLDVRAPLCSACGHNMVRSGSCYTCQVCGATSGCG